MSASAWWKRNLNTIRGHSPAVMDEHAETGNQNAQRSTAAEATTSLYILPEIPIAPLYESTEVDTGTQLEGLRMESSINPSVPSAITTPRAERNAGTGYESGQQQFSEHANMDSLVSHEYTNTSAAVRDAPTDVLERLLDPRTLPPPGTVTLNRVEEAGQVSRQEDHEVRRSTHPYVLPEIPSVAPIDVQALSPSFSTTKRGPSIQPAYKDSLKDHTVVYSTNASPTLHKATETFYSFDSEDEFADDEAEIFNELDQEALSKIPKALQQNMRAMNAQKRKELHRKTGLFPGGILINPESFSSSGHGESLEASPSGDSDVGASTSRMRRYLDAPAAENDPKPEPVLRESLSSSRHGELLEASPSGDSGQYLEEPAAETDPELERALRESLFSSGHGELLEASPAGDSDVGTSANRMRQYLEEPTAETDPELERVLRIANPDVQRSDIGASGELNNGKGKAKEAKRTDIDNKIAGGASKKGKGRAEYTKREDIEDDIAAEPSRKGKGRAKDTTTAHLELNIAAGASTQGEGRARELGSEDLADDSAAGASKRAKGKARATSKDREEHIASGQIPGAAHGLGPSTTTEAAEGTFSAANYMKRVRARYQGEVNRTSPLASNPVTEEDRAMVAAIYQQQDQLRAVVGRDEESQDKAGEAAGNVGRNSDVVGAPAESKRSVSGTLRKAVAFVKGKLGGRGKGRGKAGKQPPGPRPESRARQHEEERSS